MVWTAGARRYKERCSRRKDVAAAVKAEGGDERRPSLSNNKCSRPC